VADDALTTAKAMTYSDFDEFTRDIKKANKDQSQEWNERFNRRFGAIVLPAKMAVASMVALQFVVPWGCAVIRCEEEQWPMLKN
jgi:hypothetical protein